MGKQKLDSVMVDIVKSYANSMYSNADKLDLDAVSKYITTGEGGVDFALFTLKEWTPVYATDFISRKVYGHDWAQSYLYELHETITTAELPQFYRMMQLLQAMQEPAALFTNEMALAHEWRIDLDTVSTGGAAMLETLFAAYDDKKELLQLLTYTFCKLHRLNDDTWDFLDTIYEQDPAMIDAMLAELSEGVLLGSIDIIKLVKDSYPKDFKMDFLHDLKYTICVYMLYKDPVRYQAAVAYLEAVNCDSKNRYSYISDRNVQNTLGVYFTNHEQDHKKAMKWYTMAAKQGNTTAQYNLGLYYEFGNGVPQDYAKAAKWYTKSAEEGYSDAQYNLGLLYHNGNGVPQDYAKALQWFMACAEQDDARAQYAVGLYFYEGFVKQDYKEAMKWYEKAAKQGDAKAQNNLGLCYMQHFHRLGDIDRSAELDDYAKAIGWLKKALEQGQENAQENLDECYAKLKNTTLLDARHFKISESKECEQFIASWTPELEQEVLAAFINCYDSACFSEREQNLFSHDDVVKTPADLIKRIEDLKDFWYDTNDTTVQVSLELQEHEGRHVIALHLDCPWDQEHGWGAIFADGKLVGVERGRP
ncbi:MAG: sel1 repeat family protein [Deferribacteraceae bacterium]|nr:sel1 repeat family protein [Deferribacteraceae bacterium]